MNNGVDVQIYDTLSPALLISWGKLSTDPTTGRCPTKIY